MPSEDYTANGGKIQALLTEVSQTAGKTSHFVQRRSKLDGAGFVQALVLGCLQKTEMSLSELAQTSSKLGVNISGPGLDQRIDGEAVELLQVVFQESLQRLCGVERLDIALLRSFSAVYLLDSTQMQVPEAMSDCFPGYGGKASKAGLKIQVLYEFLTSQFAVIQPGPANQPDQKCRLQVEHSPVGALHLFDQGYFNLPMLVDLAAAQAFFITRFDHQTALFSDEAEPVRIELLACLQQVVGDRLEVSLRLGRDAKLPVRAVFQRLPPSIVEERHRKAIARMKMKGRTPSDTYLALLEWIFFVTNIPQERLTFDHILLLYRLRWQIELVFKLWKSQAGLDQLGPWRKERLLVHLYARLIGLVWFYALAAPFRWRANKELSFPKAFVAFQAKICAIIRAIQRGWHALPAVLKRLYAHWMRFDLKTHRCKHPSTLELLLNAKN